MSEIKGGNWSNIISSISQRIQNLLAHVTFTFCGADGSIHIDIIPVSQENNPSLPEGEAVLKLPEGDAIPKLSEKAAELNTKVGESKSGAELAEKKSGTVPNVNGGGGDNEHESVARTL